MFLKDKNNFTVNNLIIKLNGGTNENSDQYTFNGSGAKTVNITPAKLGAALENHVHDWSSAYITNKPQISKGGVLSSLVLGGSGEATAAYSVAEGCTTKAYGPNSHAEGYGSEITETGNAAHAEGNQSIASGVASHSEGTLTQAAGHSAHAEGNRTLASGQYSHAEGYQSQATGSTSHAEGELCKATGNFSHAEGNATMARGICSHSEGYATTASGQYAHAEGNDTVAGGDYTHAEGVSTEAIGDYSHVEGCKCIAEGVRSHAEGYQTKTTGANAHAEGFKTTAGGTSSHAEGQTTTASGQFAHSEGVQTKAENYASHAEGEYSQTTGRASHAQNYYTIAQGLAQTAIGKHNIAQGNSESHEVTDDAFIIGNGTSSTRSNAFRVTFQGLTYSKGAYNTSGADYAEFFEWSDGNTNNENRNGYFVTFDKGSNTIRKATSSDSFILGIVSTHAAIVGDNCDEWHNKYVKNEWDEIIYDRVLVEEVKETIVDEDGEETEVVISPSFYEDVPRLNPLFNKTKNYVSRENRPEWSPIGLLGKLLVYSDGSCKVGDFCRPNDEGIATKSNSGYYVLEVMDNNIIKVLVK